jgi:hypothetical protein
VSWLIRENVAIMQSRYRQKTAKDSQAEQDPIAKAQMFKESIEDKSPTGGFPNQGVYLEMTLEMTDFSRIRFYIEYKDLNSTS